MKSKMLTRLIAMTFFAALAIPLWLAAQDQEDQNKKQSDCAVIALGTRGGTFTGRGVNNEGWNSPVFESGLLSVK